MARVLADYFSEAMDAGRRPFSGLYRGSFFEPFTPNDYVS
jgi:hypothetical protein